MKKFLPIFCALSFFAMIANAAEPEAEMDPTGSSIVNESVETVGIQSQGKAQKKPKEIWREFVEAHHSDKEKIARSFSPKHCKLDPDRNNLSYTCNRVEQTLTYTAQTADGYVCIRKDCQYRGSLCIPRNKLFLCDKVEWRTTQSTKPIACPHGVLPVEAAQPSFCLGEENSSR